MIIEVFDHVNKASHVELVDQRERERERERERDEQNQILKCYSGLRKTAFAYLRVESNHGKIHLIPFCSHDH